MHLVQAKTRLPEGNLVHCKLGYFLLLVVGLYLPRSFTRRQTTIDDLPQIEHCLDIKFYSFNYKFICKNADGKEAKSL